jgi:hypothetical protein
MNTALGLLLMLCILGIIFMVILLTDEAAKPYTVDDWFDQADAMLHNDPNVDLEAWDLIDSYNDQHDQPGRADHHDDTD